jgi:2-polyprenyl-3-methyl-5-hydroxy-6-metoxy-1,4-benzoquinol methylase
MSSPPDPGGLRAAESHWSAFDAAGIQRLVAAEDRHFWFRARNQIIAALIAPTIEALSDGFRILEVGCGSGNVLRVLQRLARDRGVVEALELSPEAAEVARARTGLSVTNGYLSDLDASATFDIIAAFDVLEHISDEHAVLQQMRARLRPGGRLVLTVPAHQGLWSSFDVASGHVRRYSPASLSKALRATGFRVEYLSYFMSLLFPPMWLRRRLANRNTNDMAATLDSEFQVVPVVNTIAYELLRREASAVGRRWRLPMGTSLVVVAVPVKARTAAAR